jgi:hypothetical protein
MLDWSSRADISRPAGVAGYPADDLDLMAGYLARVGLPFTVRSPDALRTALPALAERLSAATT